MTRLASCNYFQKTYLHIGIIQNYRKNNVLHDKYLSEDAIIKIVKSIMGLEPLYVIKDFQ